MINDIIDLHTHSIASGHSFNTIDEIVRTASQKGAKIIGISDHAPAMEGSLFRQYLSALKKVPHSLFGIRVLIGAELNILDREGTLDLDEDYSGLLDYAIASLHIECIEPGTKQENTKAFINAMRNPEVFVLGHPDDGTFELDYELLASKAAENHVLIELNEASVRPNSYRKNGRQNAKALLSACKKYGTQIIISSDAHSASNVMKHTYAIRFIEEMEFPEELIVNSSVDRLMELLSYRKHYAKQALKAAEGE